LIVPQACFPVTIIGQLEKKLEELSNKIDGYNAKTITIESQDVTAIEES
jgi:hypothetical protein